MSTESLYSQPALPTFEQLVEKAQSGNQQALIELREVLDDRPEIWRSIGDLAEHARLTVIRSISGGNALLFESLIRKCQQMRDEMVGESPSALEELAVDRILAAWLEAEYLELQHPETAAGTLEQAKFIQRAKQSAQKAFDTATKNLIAIRRMQRAEARTGAKRPQKTVPYPVDGNQKVPAPAANGQEGNRTAAVA